MYEEEKKEFVVPKWFIIVFAFIIIILLVIFVSIILKGENKTKSNPNDISELQTDNTQQDNLEPEKKLQILDLESKTRPIAVMINNHPEAVRVQAGLQDAYLVYEMQVEYGLTRLMAIFKDKTTTKIGSVRSSRHNYLDYALENDAIYVHFGYSEIAEKQIPQLGINNINGLYDGAFWRDNTLNVAYEHTAFTNMEKIMANAALKGYRTASSKDTLLNYSIEPIYLKDNSDSQTTTKVDLIFSTSTVVSFVYDATNHNYKRFVNNVENKDYVTKEQYTAQNIIVMKVKNTFASGSAYLQDYQNIGEGDGYYITNGYAVPIKWSKESRSSQTVYSYLNGEEITVNDGNTYIEIVPLGNSVKIS